MEIFSPEQFKAIVNEQIKLNEHYSGEKWDETVSPTQFIAAIYAELGELLESTPRSCCETGWKWWRKDVENDINNAKIEAVDILHFALSVLIQIYDVNVKKFSKIMRNFMKLIRISTQMNSKGCNL
jgi:dimeric dUTPase (all-alpha-NTP-PPase superfamily)